MSRSAEQFLIEQHEMYINQVTESGMPVWLMDYYSKINSQWQEEYLNNERYENSNENPRPDDTGDDTHLFI